MLARASIDQMRSKLMAGSVEEERFIFQAGSVAQLEFLLKEAMAGSDPLAVFSADDWTCLAKKCSLALFKGDDTVFTRGVDAQHIGLILEGRLPLPARLPSHSVLSDHLACRPRRPHLLTFD